MRKRIISISSVTIEKLPPENKVKRPKLKNFGTLLTLYDEEWKNVEKFCFYKTLLEKNEAVSSCHNYETENVDSGDDEDNNRTMIALVFL